MRYTSIVLVMLAALFWGISGAIAEILMDKGWNPLVISFYRGFVGFLFFFIWSLVKWRGDWIPSVGFSLWAVLAGIGVVGNFTFYFLSIEAASISVAVTLMYTAPVFVLLTALVLGFERSTMSKWLSVVFVLFGIVLLTGAYEIDTVSATIFGTVFGLASGLSYTLFIFGFKNASLIGNPRSTLTLAFLSFSIVLFILMDMEEALNVLTSEDIGWFVLLGLLGAGISFFIYIIGLRRTPPTTASVVAMIEPVTASLIGILFLGNQLSLIQFVGMVIILVTITSLSLKQKA
ncbi:MAG: EamA family transporter [Bacillota bacterium]